MTERTVQSINRGFLFLDSHPAGCARLVADLARQVPAVARQGGRPVALIIGSSAGYGLAATVAGIARYGIDGVGLCFEKAPTQRRTATAGWYRSAATARLAADTGSDFSFINGDTFADATKTDVLDQIAATFGGVDYLVYSVAAPRRTDPDTGAVHSSVIKPIGTEHRTETLQFNGDVPQLREVTIEPATDAEIADTVKVMGGEDWARWIDALDGRDLLRPGFTTVALSYIGSPLNSAIYREGSIGAAKAHLEQTAGTLTDRWDGRGPRALTSVHGAAVTQASTAIPGIGLYVSLLRAVLGDTMHSPIRQSIDLWDQLTGHAPLATDEHGRLRLDQWELTPDVQEAVTDLWNRVTDDTISELADTTWFLREVRRLYGFDVASVDYEQPCDVHIPWPNPIVPTQ